MKNVITFNSVYYAMKAEKELKDKNEIEVKLISTPRELSSDCGIALEILSGNIEKRVVAELKLSGRIVLVIPLLHSFKNRPVFFPAFPEALFGNVALNDLLPQHLVRPQQFCGPVGHLVAEFQICFFDLAFLFFQQVRL